MSRKALSKDVNKAGNSQMAVKAGDKKRRKSRKHSFKRHIYGVLKEVHSDTGISSKAMSTMEELHE
ncbi:hypothetical protein M513_09844 [Trichuris suis]|uniref:Histone H2A/H2B/H3 domain-containing protein n=1 Tax=Trichuris suis TaxID=68888 RepID=A0A085LWE6_9BILA|nr:hypothetical protein M513_09844 [Trichuris suis]